ncbi:hypothetical protein TNCV_3956481 [Trichonephila clavipes]|nr:hypothetical protein TNCV_3956481 [Trichonephila clavipes]
MALWLSSYEITMRIRLDKITRFIRKHSQYQCKGTLLADAGYYFEEDVPLYHIQSITVTSGALVNRPNALLGTSSGNLSAMKEFEHNIEILELDELYTIYLAKKLPLKDHLGNVQMRQNNVVDITLNR